MCKKNVWTPEDKKVEEEEEEEADEEKMGNRITFLLEFFVHIR